MPLLHLFLDLRLDLRAELEHLELAAQDRGDLTQPRPDVGELEQRLLLLGLQAQRRGDEVRERARVLDVRGGELQLFGQIRDEPDHPCEEALDVPRERLDLGCLFELIRQIGELADEIGVILQRPHEPDASQTLDEDAQGPVGNLDHLVDHGRGPDEVEVVEAGLLRLRILDGDESEHAIAGDHVLDELDRALLADRERRHRLRKHDRVLQRQHRKRGREGQCLLALLVQDFGHQDILTVIETLSRTTGLGAIESLMVRIPRS